MDDSDETLAAGAKAGDNTAFDELARRHRVRPGPARRLLDRRPRRGREPGPGVA